MPRLLLLLAIVVALAAGTLLLAVRTQGPRADLVWTAGPEVETLDPAKMTALQDGRVAEALFEGLTVPRSPDLKPVPGVAERWDISPDGLTYTFHLRKNACWSDGRPVTAEDFVYAWRRVLTPAVAASYAYMIFDYVRGAKAYYDAAAKDPARADWSKVGVRTDGPYTLIVELEHPTAYFLDLVAFDTYLPVRRDNVERWGPRWTYAPNLISNGAYRLAEWQYRSRMIWEKNPHYWNRDAVALGRIELRLFEDQNTALMAYETGAVDLTAIVPALAQEPLLEARKAGRRTDVLHAVNFGTYFYRFNCSRAPFNDPRVRRALALAVDRRMIIDRGARGGQEPATTLVPPGVAAYPRPAGVTEDVAEARRLLAEAGYPGGRGLREFAVVVNKGLGHVPIAELVQQQWRDRLGVSVRIEQVEWKFFLDKVQKIDYDVARGSWYGDYIDPNTFIDLFVTGGGNNQTGWSSARYDALVRQAARETDPAARLQRLADAERILLDEMPVLPLYFYTTMMLVRPGLEGVDGNLRNRIDFGALRWKTRP